MGAFLRRLAPVVLALVLGAVALAIFLSGTRGVEPADGSAGPPAGRLFFYGYPKSDRGTVNGTFLYSMDLPGGNLHREQLRTLGIGDPIEFIDFTGGRLVYFGAGGRTYSIDPRLSSRPRSLGRSLYFVASGSDGRVWLQRQPGDHRTRKSTTVDEVEVGNGRVVTRGRLTKPPCPGPTVVAAAVGALLCQTGGPMIATDPSSGKVLMKVPDFPLATGGDLVAACGEPCPRLVVASPSTGEKIRIEARSSFRWAAGYDGDFSPDLSTVAVPVRPAGTRPRSRVRELALVNLQYGSTHLPPQGARGIESGPTFSASTRFTADRGRLSASDQRSRSGRRLADGPFRPPVLNGSRVPGVDQCTDVVRRA
jgi:hypothetical protein